MMHADWHLGELLVLQITLAYKMQQENRDPGNMPGPWAGPVVSTDQGLVKVSVSQECWVKAKNMIFWIRDSLRESDTIDHKMLESHRGFLIYISRTYLAITPYLKGIHLTLDSWRPWRSEDAWKLSLAEIKTVLAAKNITYPLNTAGDKPPSKVKVAPLLHDDVAALTLYLPQKLHPAGQFIQRNAMKL
jgi:hypothetical protein